MSLSVDLGRVRKLSKSHTCWFQYTTEISILIIRVASSPGWRRTTIREEIPYVWLLLSPSRSKDVEILLFHLECKSIPSVVVV